jgi:sulfatase maturation enzyme AslB (radical SAM superfamily)
MLISQPTDLNLNRMSSIQFPLLPKDFKNPPVTEKRKCTSDCPWYYFCAGGCPIEASQSCGSHNEHSPYCAVYRELIPEVLRLEALRLLKYNQLPDFEVAITKINFGGLNVSRKY